jgi:hypothetical protein
MDEKIPISVNSYIKYPSHEVYKKLKVLAAEKDISLGDLIGKIIEYVLEDQNRIEEILKRIEQDKDGK